MPHQKPTESISNPFSSRIGRRIILIMVVLSGLLTLSTTLLQLYWDYKQEINEINQKHYEVENVHSELLVSSLWSYDLALLQQHLELLVNLPKVQYLEIRSLQTVISAGEKVVNYPISDSYPLIYYNVPDQRHEEIGTIYIESNAEEIYTALAQQFLTTLTINAVKTLLVCGILLLVFHSSINQRIFQVVDYLRRYNPRHPALPLELNSHKWIIEENDELDLLGYEANRITANITKLYQNIQHEKERLADFTQVSSDWLWETDHQGRLIYCSDSMLDALQLDILQQPTFKQLPCFANAHHLHQLLQSKQSFQHCELGVVLSDQSCYLMLQAIARYKDERFVGFRGTALDISSLKQTQLQLHQLNENLEQQVVARTQDLELSLSQLQKTQQQLIEAEKLSALGGLVAGVAHEVNTPLGISVTASSIINESILQLNQAFSDQTLTSTQFAELMQNMTSSGEMLTNNLNRAAKLIRDFKQTAVDQVSESRCEFELLQSLDALIASLHSETRKIPVTPHIICSTGSIKMNSLPGVISQIVTNLVLNSVNHAFEQQPNAEIVIELSEHDDNVLLEYRDNGCGVEPHLHHKIFEPFYTSKRGYGGSGLGLNLVFNLVKQKLQGELTFESELNQGVKFTITLPKVLLMNINQQNENDN